MYELDVGNPQKSERQLRPGAAIYSGKSHQFLVTRGLGLQALYGLGNQSKACIKVGNWIRCPEREPTVNQKKANQIEMVGILNICFLLQYNKYHKCRGFKQYTFLRSVSVG